MTDQSGDRERGPGDREQGIQFRHLRERLDGVDYPITNEDLLEQFGDHSLGLSDGETTLAETLSPLAGTTYGSGEDVCRELMNMVGDDAIGRKAYTDREPTNQYTTGRDTHDSF